MERYRRALDLFGAVVDRVDAGRWGDPSPCPGWSAAAVVGHVINGTRMIMAAAVEDPPVPPAADPAAIAGDDPRRAWHARRAEIDAILARIDPDARVPTAQGIMRIDDGLGQAVVEPLVHAWDLATATGQRIDLPDDLVIPLLDALAPAEAMIRGSGMFAGPRPVPADASPPDRLLAFLGR
jgi:uncharacterized protein (TIGR03086 family)